MQASTQELLSFSSPLAYAEILRSVTDYVIPGRNIVVNMSASDAWVGAQQSSALPPFSSTILVDGRVSGHLLGVFSVQDIPEQEHLARNLGWTDFYGPGEDHPVLLKSVQQSLGAVEIDKAQALHSPGLGVGDFELKANLWFSPAGTDCGIHNEHPFIEIHTQISGIGRMQKFTAKDQTALYEDQILAPGATNPVPFCTQQPAGFLYPWHQYKADTDCIWLALEYHQI
ncbi:hypothetical protein D6T63_13390 [Arthrobacter cheniae]|uniref:Uncharacterized protein n=1 Tax=Arthrobacter cheniae TaxID=1258888 RepID=A0A3A5M3H5_9MICC|nr:hypothetical protein [Arthrobacter cheniae]RJT77950.1 hypothetical protein D6T63_13390 [Arthrobacter cheniae]